MKEFAARMNKVNLDGPNGCAEIDVRFRVSVAEARLLSALMLQSGFPLRVLVPESTPTVLAGTASEVKP